MTYATNSSFAPVPAIGIPYRLNGNRLMGRLAQRMGAATMMFVALFVWLAPGAGWESDIMLFKLMVSIIAAFLCVGLWQASLPPLPPIVEIDVAACEIRLVREGAPADQRILERCAFCDLHLVELEGRHITFWGHSNRLLAEITLSNATAHASLLAALRSAGKLL
ncbi:hypothetical protein [Sulfitobacter donghicola]|uniref:Uncharacterized protein n=1 Tax=Sulfitobacter donghicola DSW-25 = KCTC 12864 = JCM 14565 TaxID=1300350 RepID=A0A073IJ30_9RHOB|nr:hypothetical protein [Sulfitobacter donghicola]KEJ90338.1 hypothetical protein DSW25_08320 [Sulfitobacter donghicola DSW-25 = KCTC 12864 = JCM 14565]KIN66645.1 hypothetical protein Z948_345 [Sulfitobacter donghicola DSW-25 = KCTC 12864 = JCM 14565]